MVLSGHGPRKQLAEKAARVMQLLDNDVDESDLKLRVTTGPPRRAPVAAQASPRQQLSSQRRGGPRLSLQLSEGHECDLPTPNHARASNSSFGKPPSASPRLAASQSCGSASTGSPDGSQSRGHGVALRVDTLGRHVSTIRHSASTSVLESAPLSSVRRSSSSGGLSGQATKTTRHGENHHRGAADATHNAAGATNPSAAARAPPLSRPGLKSSSVGSAAASNVPQSRRPQHYDTWHGESLDRVPIPRVQTVGSVVAARSSHHLSPRESPRLQLHHPGGQRAEPTSCTPHNLSPRSSSGTAAIHGTPKSRSDPDFGGVDKRPVLQAPLRQLSSDLGTRGPTRTLSRQIRRPSDDDAPEPFVTNHHASPVDHSRQRCDTRGPAGLGASYDHFPASSTVGRAERGRMSAVAQAYSPFDASSPPASPSASSPRFPCSIPSPRPIAVTSPAAYQQSPRQLMTSTSVGSGSPGPARQEGRGGDGRHRSSQQLSSFDSWDDSEPLYDDPTLQITPSPRSRLGFSGRQHAEIQLQEGDYHGADGSGTPPLNRWLPDRRPAPSTWLPDCRLPRRSVCDEHSVRHTPGGSHGGAGVHVQRAGEASSAGENTWWVGEEGGGKVQAAPWKEEFGEEDVHATRGWQGDLQEAGLEHGGTERRGPILAQVQHADLVPELGERQLRCQTRKTDSFQRCAAAGDSLEGSKQQARPRGRPDSQRLSEDADAGGVRGSESKGSSKSREKPKSKLQRSLSDDDEEEEQAKVLHHPGGQRAEPYSHLSSQRSTGGTAAVHGAPKSRSDPHFAAVDTRPVLHAPQRQPSGDLGARGPTRTLSRQIRRAPDDDLGEPFVTRTHHASPVDHSRQRCDGRGPAGSGGSFDDFPACSTVGRVERGRRCAAAQACSPFDASSSPTSPSAASPRFPCSIPSPRHNPVTSPAAYQQSPRQLLVSTSVGSGSPAPARGERRGGDGRHRSSQQHSSCDSWDNSEPIYDHDDPMLQISPSPRSPRGFSSPQHAEFQSDSEEEEDCRDAGGSGTRRPLSRWRSHSLAEDPIEEDPTARRVHTLDRRPVPSQSLPDCRLPRRSCDERSMRHTLVDKHGGTGVDMRRSGEKIGAGEKARWKGEDSSESGEEDVEAMGEWQREVQEAGLERGEKERRGPTLKRMQGGMDIHQTR
ncbi:unnamed protein product [Closterium sp. Naga37s-1]|nr:unnamed protein product [Closterium sp. Naga37s-1]